VNGAHPDPSRVERGRAAVTPTEYESRAMQQRGDSQAAGYALAEHRKRRQREGETE
jgi:hypothetical protein